MDICWRCNGEGRLFQPSAGDVDIYERCDECNGRGELPPQGEETEWGVYELNAELAEEAEDKRRRRLQERNEY
jgi:DnaJ-class molecular chaperone